MNVVSLALWGRQHSQWLHLPISLASYLELFPDYEIWLHIQADCKYNPRYLLLQALLELWPRLKCIEVSNATHVEMYKLNRMEPICNPTVQRLLCRALEHKPLAVELKAIQLFEQHALKVLQLHLPGSPTADADLLCLKQGATTLLNQLVAVHSFTTLNELCLEAFQQSPGEVLEAFLLQAEEHQSFVPLKVGTTKAPDVTSATDQLLMLNESVMHHSPTDFVSLAPLFQAYLRLDLPHFKTVHDLLKNNALLWQYYGPSSVLWFPDYSLKNQC